MEVYKITNKITGDFYIGQTDTGRNDYLGSGRLIKKQIKKYGKENFNYELLVRLNRDLENGRSLLLFIEYLIIKKYINNEKCINISIGSKNSIIEYYKEPIIETTVDYSDLLGF